MATQNPAYWFWRDIRLGKFWYVFMWRKTERPLLYRSTDATPPCREPYDNKGKWYFGRGQG